MSLDITPRQLIGMGTFYEGYTFDKDVTGSWFAPLQHVWHWCGCLLIYKQVIPLKGRIGLVNESSGNDETTTKMQQQQVQN